LEYNGRLLKMGDFAMGERLDVGCGRGLILNAAARRLTTGKAYGIEYFSRSGLFILASDFVLIRRANDDAKCQAKRHIMREKAQDGPEGDACPE
jgi:hypothetical protein